MFQVLHNDNFVGALLSVPGENIGLFVREDHRECGGKAESRESPSPLAQSQNDGLVAGLSGRSRVRSPVGAVEEFSSSELTFCADSCCGIRSRFTFRFFIHQVSQQGTCLESGVTALAHNRLQSFCKSARGRLQLNTHTLSSERSLSGLTELSR